MDTEKVFKKIKSLSKNTLNPRHRILLKDLSRSLSINDDTLLVSLAELENRGLISIHKAGVVSISLSNYGVEQSETSGGLESQ